MIINILEHQFFIKTNNMKKICFTLVLLLVAFVANAQQYKVYSVSGNVTVDGKPAAARQVLTGKSILSISKGGKIVLFNTSNKKLTTLKVAGKGTVDTLVKMTGNTGKMNSGSYLPFITNKITTDETKDNTYMQSAGTVYREEPMLPDSIRPNAFAMPNDSIRQAEVE